MLHGINDETGSPSSTFQAQGVLEIIKEEKTRIMRENGNPIHVAWEETLWIGARIGGESEGLRAQGGMFSASYHHDAIRIWDHDGQRIMR